MQPGVRIYLLYRFFGSLDTTFAAGIRIPSRAGGGERELKVGTGNGEEWKL